MTMTDPIADMLTRIRNAITGAPRRRCSCPSSKLKERIAEVLKDEGFIAGYDVARATTSRAPDRRRAALRPTTAHQRHRRACAASRVPGSASTSRHGPIPKVRSGLGIAILSDVARAS